MINTNKKEAIGTATANDNKPSHIKPLPKKASYLIVIDNGKPYEERAESEAELRAVLKEQYAESQKEDYAYFDVKIFDESNFMLLGESEDISESQFITEMIGEIIESDTTSEANE